MAFAFFYNTADLAMLQTQLQAAVGSLSGNDRTLVNRLITALTNYQNAPKADVSRQQNDADTRVVTINASGLTKVATHDLLARVYAAVPSAVHLQAIAKDMVSTAVEPWP